MITVYKYIYKYIYKSFYVLFLFTQKKKACLDGYFNVSDKEKHNFGTESIDPPRGAVSVDETFLGRTALQAITTDALSREPNA